MTPMEGGDILTACGPQGNQVLLHPLTQPVTGSVSVSLSQAVSEDGLQLFSFTGPAVCSSFIENHLSFRPGLFRQE